MRGKVVRLKISEAAAELNVCCKTVHNYIQKYEAMVELTRDDLLPSSPKNGLRGTSISVSCSGRITWRVDHRDITDYIENASQEVLERTLYNWRVNR